jgi:hypothetical protein
MIGFCSLRANGYAHATRKLTVFENAVKSVLGGK